MVECSVDFKVRRRIKKLTLYKIRAKITVEVYIWSWHFIRLAPNVTLEVDIL